MSSQGSLTLWLALLNECGSALRSIASWQMEGHTIPELGTKLRRSERSIAAKFAVIRNRWRREESS